MLFSPNICKINLTKKKNIKKIDQRNGGKIQLVCHETNEANKVTTSNYQYHH